MKLAITHYKIVSKIHAGTCSDIRDVSVRNLVKSAIELSLSKAFNPAHLEVINLSHMHSVPENSETHFKVILVSPIFDG